MAVILAGGRGTRLRPFTMVIPKPLLPLGDIPILEVVVRQLVACGFRRIVLALNHMAPLFASVVGDGTRWGVEIEHVTEPEALGTAGSLRLVRPIPEHFLVMNGDVLTTLDFRALMRVHKSRGGIATIATHEREVAVDYGVLRADERQQLRAYEEKPCLKYSVSMGIYVLSRTALELLPAQGRFDMPELMVAAMKAGQAVYCHRTDCYWQDIGRMDDYQRASEDFVENPQRFLRRVGRTPGRRAGEASGV